MKWVHFCVPQPGVHGATHSLNYRVMSPHHPTCTLYTPVFHPHPRIKTVEFQHLAIVLQKGDKHKQRQYHMLIRCKMHMTKSTQSRKPRSQQQQHRVIFPQKKQIHGYSRLQIIWESFLSVPFPSEHNTWLNLNITFPGQLRLPKATCSNCIWMRQEEELKRKKLQE